MSFTVYASNLTCEKNVVNKLGYITSVGQYTGTLKDGTSILSPIILLESTTTPAFNYASISNFGNRYYFITDIVNVRSNLWEISMVVDVLYTYHSNILTQTAFVSRNENTYNENLSDAKYPMTFNKTVSKVSTTLRDGTWGVTTSMTTTGYFLFSFNAKYIEQGTTHFNSNFPTTYIATNYQGMLDLLESMRSGILAALSWADISKYLISLDWIPTADTATGINVSGKTIVFPGLTNSVSIPSSNTYYLLTNAQNYITWSFGVSSRSPKYLGSSPYREIILSFQPFGNVPLDTQLLVSGSTFTSEINVAFNFLSGNALLYNRKNYNTTEPLRNIAGANLKVNFPIFLQNVNIGDAFKTISSVVGAGVSASTENYGNLAQQAMGLYNDIFSVGTYSANGSPIGGIVTTPIVYVYDRDTVAQSPSLYGRPLERAVVLNTLTGYTIVHSIHLSGINATSTEIDQIESLLKAGVIL